jgi:hypothetical protein
MHFLKNTAESAHILQRLPKIKQIGATGRNRELLRRFQKRFGPGTIFAGIDIQGEPGFVQKQPGLLLHLVNPIGPEDIYTRRTGFDPVYTLPVRHPPPAGFHKS